MELCEGGFCLVGVLLKSCLPIIVRDVCAAALTLGTEFVPLELFAAVRTFCHIKSTFEKFIFS